MSMGKLSEREQAALDAYRAAANAEADAHFDERALETQRHKILARLAHLGQTAKVIRFPVVQHGDVPMSGVNRRWISVAAAAGLIIGLLGGQLVHLVPQQSRRMPPMATTIAPSAPRPAVGPANAVFEFPQDDGLLDEVDFAVQVRRASELQALDELTPFHEPR
jgi:hypothetical protein